MNAASRQPEKEESVGGRLLEAAEQQQGLLNVAQYLLQLASIVESSPDAIVGKTLEGIIQTWNPGAEHLYGYSADEVHGKSIDLLLPPDRSHELTDILAKLERGDRIERFETVRRCKDGSLVDVSVSISPIKDSSGKIVGAASIARDITDRKRAEAERDMLLAQIGELAAVSQRRAAELQTILDNMVDGVIVCDTSRRITLANEAAAHMIGLEELDKSLRLRGLPKLLNTRHIDGRPLRPEDLVLARALKGAIVTEMDEVFTNAETGKDVHIRMSGAPIRDEQGKIVAAVGVARDVTELSELERLKDEFISVAAHELKTPVSIMKGFAQALLRLHGDISPAERRMLEAINRGSDRIDRIVQDLLDISKLHVGRLELTIEPIDLPEMVAEVVDRMALTTVKHRLRLIDSEPVVVHGDRDRLEQVLVNLLGNAIKYSPNGGDIDVTVGLREDKAFVGVKDHGVGIPSEKQHDIFERFYRAHTGTPNDYGGMGVGLYISREILARHGGEISFQSEAGHGSTFYFSLPIGSSTPRPAPSATSSND